jgi:hypothetical protein
MYKSDKEKNELEGGSDKKEFISKWILMDFTLVL